MVSHYKRKTDRGKWSPKSMKLAIDAVVRGEVGYRKAADSFHIPQTILEGRVKITRKQGNAPPEMPSLSVNSKMYTEKPVQSAICSEN